MWPWEPISIRRRPPGLIEGGHEFYTVAGGFAAREVLERFEGGRVVIGVLSTPYKCPPAPSETALLLHEQLVARGLRERSEIALVIDFGRPIPPSPAASAALLEAFAERDIEWHPSREVCELDPARNVAILRDGGEMPYDLFLAVPVHRAPAVVTEAGLTENGWIGVDAQTFETSFPGVYALGDVAAVGTPRAGVFAEGHAAIAAEHIAARIRGRDQLGPIRGSRHLLPGVRSRRGRHGGRHLLRRPAIGRAHRPVGRPGGREGRVRLQPDQALVRPRLVTDPCHRRVIRLQRFLRLRGVRHPTSRVCSGRR